MRELTEEEESRLLTQKDVDALPVGTPIMVKWFGGNGPHQYIVGRDERGTHALMGENDQPVLDSMLDVVGADKFAHRVFLPD